MRKILFSVLALVLIASVAQAEVALNPLKGVYISRNNTETSAVNIIPTDVIVPNKSVITRVEVVSTGARYGGGLNTETVVGLYDATSTVYALDKMIECELESNDFDGVFKVFARPLAVANGITLIQGAFTVVTVEYERARP